MMASSICSGDSCRLADITGSAVFKMVASSDCINSAIAAVQARPFCCGVIMEWEGTFYR